MCSPRPGSRAEVKGIVLVPLSNCMRMTPKEAFGIVGIGRSAPKTAYFIDLQIAEYTMMSVVPFGRSEQAEEEKHVTYPDTVALEMRLRCAGLPKGPAPVVEHRVFVAEIGCANTPFGDLLNDLSES